MHRALYRKYRPSTFSDVYGQDHVSQTLKNQIANGTPSHAYLFTGSRGTGKTSTAKILSKAVNCLNPQNGDPCCECEMCRGIDNGSVLDVVEIDAASNNGVDNIRELREKIAYAPISAKYKVYIIDEVHMLSDGAFNALLKTLEEPPSHAIFILATTEVHKIPATILSRCQRYDFSRIPAAVIADRLRYICDKEGFDADENALKLIAKLADGGMRDAVSMLDLCAGVSGSVTEQGVAQSVGLIDKSYVFKIAELIEKKDTAALLGEINTLYNASCDMERLCFELISHYRDLMVAKTTKGFRDLITATNEELDEIEKQSKSIKFENMMYAVSMISECVKAMKSGGDKRGAVETTMIRLCVPSLDSSVEALVSRIAALEEKIKHGVPMVQAGENAPDMPKKDNAEPNSSNAVGNMNNEPKPTQNNNNATQNSTDEVIPFDNWAEVMERLSSAQPMLHAVMDESSAYISGTRLLIDAPNPSFRPLINGNPKMYEAIKEAVFSVSGVRYGIGPYNSQKIAERRNVEIDPLERFAKNNSDVVDVE